MVPKLRFKEFCGEWEEKRLGDIMNSFDYGMNSASMEFDGENKYIRITDIDENTHRYLNENRVSPSGELDDKYIVEKNDILFARTGASTGKTYLYNEKDGKLYFAGFLIRGNVKENYDSYFVYSQTLTENYNKWVSLTSMRSGQPGINSNEYSNYKCNFPSLPEQTKIADFLSTVDDKIQNQQDKITHLENIKKGFMQKIFSRKIRFKDDGGEEFPEWEEKKLGDICKMFSGGTPTSGKSEYYGGNINFIRSGEIHLNKTELTLTQLGFDSSSAKLVEIGDILYALYGATSGEVNISKINGAINQAILCIRPDEYYNKKYLAEILNFKKKSILNTYLQGGQGNLSGEIIKNLKLKFPCLKEQQKIADFLSSFDEKISIEKETLEHLKQLKKGLLQQMFV